MTDDLQLTKELADRAEGWLTDREGALLYHLAKACRGNGVIVEIGSWKGKSTIWLARGSKQGRSEKVYAIDPHTGAPEHEEDFGKHIWTFDVFTENISRAGVSDIVTPIVATSSDAAGNFNQPVEVIFIDGAHDYEFVSMDFKLWFPKLSDGGIIAFHDTGSWPGPKRVVEESLYRSRYFRKIRVIDSITYAEKEPSISIIDFIENHIKLAVRKLPDYILEIKKVLRDTFPRLFKIYKLLKTLLPLNKNK